MHFQIACIVCLVPFISSRPVMNNGQNEVNVNKYLMTYGYLSDSAEAHTEEDVKDALAYFQTFVGLPVTGLADEATVTMMQKPRCAMKDVETELGAGHSGRQKRYVHRGGRWRRRTLSYGVVNNMYPRRMSRSSTNVVLKESFQMWEAVTNMKFTMAPTQQRLNPRSVDIAVKFARGNHGDGSPFDGIWGVMAHAFFPFFGGDIHFDDDEFWTAGRGNINLKQIAVHEIGHSLGLGHSQVRTAVMAPMYLGYNPNFRLHNDDIRGVQQLYGGPRTSGLPSLGDRGDIVAEDNSTLYDLGDPASMDPIDPIGFEFGDPVMEDSDPDIEDSDPDMEDSDPDMEDSDPDMEDSDPANMEDSDPANMEGVDPLNNEASDLDMEDDGYGVPNVMENSAIGLHGMACWLLTVSVAVLFFNMAF